MARSRKNLLCNEKLLCNLVCSFVEAFRPMSVFSCGNASSAYCRNFKHTMRAAVCAPPLMRFPAIEDVLILESLHERKRVPREKCYTTCDTRCHRRYAGEM